MWVKKEQCHKTIFFFCACMFINIIFIRVTDDSCTVRQWTFEKKKTVNTIKFGVVFNLVWMSSSSCRYSSTVFLAVRVCECWCGSAVSGCTLTTVRDVLFQLWVGGLSSTVPSLSLPLCTVSLFSAIVLWGTKGFHRN